MDLGTILEKTKSRNAKLARLPKERTHLYIATEERPYSSKTYGTSPNQDQQKSSEGRFMPREQTVNKSVTNREQTVNKSVTNREQTVNKSVTNREQNREQTVNKSVTNREQTVNKELPAKTNREQTVNKPVTNSSFSHLVGIQKLIVLFLYEECKKNCLNSTRPLTLEEIKSATRSTKMAIKTSIYRLEKKNMICKESFKAGRGGWTQYRLSEELFSELKISESTSVEILNREQTVNKPVTNPPLISSISFSNTTGGEKLKSKVKELPEGWEEINYEELEIIGFGRNQLNQIYELGLCSTEMVQSSIRHFAYGLKYNEKVKRYESPLNVLMGVLRKGQMWTEAKYESPQSIAQRELIERKKRETKEYEKLREDAFQVALDQWKIKLSQKETEALIASHPKGENRLLPLPNDIILNLHFKENIWPSLEEKYVIDMT